MLFLQVNEVTFPSQHETLLPCLPGFFKTASPRGSMQADAACLWSQWAGVFHSWRTLCSSSLQWAQLQVPAVRAGKGLGRTPWAAEWHCKGDTLALEGTRVFSRPLGVKSLGKHWWLSPEWGWWVVMKQNLHYLGAIQTFEACCRNSVLKSGNLVLKAGEGTG